MVTWYLLDSSVAVRVILGHSPEAAAWIDEVNADPDRQLIASRLLKTEITRVLRREGLPVSRRDDLLDYVQMIPVNDAVLAEAEAIVPHIKTLDAIHLASIVRTGLDATVVTHDETMGHVAEILGYPVLDPVVTAS
ncbi:PIN domain-containing protein [Propionimicrobium sp. PCR01-08-3]|uniref:type II toxin-antitoxin system VapC family toxin n=1 Tax=Propionimicrobium sp. PCR01-08-3 TaxID=3052086 RepID=UPI00255C9D60|nr:PIN domain-containing protein [Propionimicrobium sp. PCR01-08-3]WIY83682.1 PIN domain-containing protein [Propionimicrobium sp. PCR01-08-3]